MRKFFSLSLGALIFSLLAGGVAFAHGPHHGRHCDQGGFYPPQMPQLSQEQMDKARQIMGEYGEQMQKTRQNLAAKETDLANEMVAQQPDKGRIESLSREIGELRGTLMATQAEIRGKLGKAGVPAPNFGPGQGYGPMGAFAPCYGPQGPCAGAMGPCGPSYPCGPNHMGPCYGNW